MTADDVSAGTVVQVDGLEGEQIVLQVWNGEVGVQPIAHQDAPVIRVARAAIVHVVRPPTKQDMQQVGEHYRSRRGQPAGEEGAAVNAAAKTAALKKGTTRKAPAKAPVKKAAPKKAPASKAPALKVVENGSSVERLQPSAELKKAGVVRITGRTPAKQKINFAILEAVLLGDQDPAKVGEKHGIGTAQVRKIIGLAKGTIDPDRKL